MREGNVILNKECPGCLMDFQTKVVDRVFCSRYCRNKVHRERERRRDEAAKPRNFDEQMYFMAPVANPTVDLIVRLADTMVIAKTEKPILFYGTMPRVDLSNMKVRLDATANANEWIMFYDENAGQDIMELLQNK